MAKLVLITGASRGIGRVIAARLASEGYSLVLTARTAQALDQAVAELRQAGADARGMAVDLTKPNAPDQLRGAVDGTPWALINNAGMAESAPLARTDDSLIERHLQLNFMAPMRLMRAFAPHIADNGGGRIVNVLSTAALAGYPYVSAYAASKHALLGATRSLAREFGARKVTFNAVCPGYVRTEMFAKTVANIAQKTGSDADAAEQKLMALSPQQRVFEPEEVANTVAFLLREDSGGINGQALSIDGGEILH